ISISILFDTNVQNILCLKNKIKKTSNGIKQKRKRDEVSIEFLINFQSSTPLFKVFLVVFFFFLLIIEPNPDHKRSSGTDMDPATISQKLVGFT
ncbi:MAG: hypothetical protein ACN6PN_08100, partial [Sphingobacterium sp.]